MPNRITWILDRTAIALHKETLAEHGGEPGLRDPILLKSALARPKNLAAYGQPAPDHALLAAAYAYGVVKNHPFVDGNKRMGLILLRLFLRLNGNEIEVSQQEKYQHIFWLADSTISEEDLALWVHEHKAIR